MVKRSLFFIITAVLVLSGCTAGLTNTVIPIKITLVDDGVFKDNKIFIREEIQLTVSPLGPTDSVEWEVAHECESENSCYNSEIVGQILFLTGVEACEEPVIVTAESATGARDNISLSVEERVKEPPVKNN